MLKNKVVLITGATGGMGSAVVREFARTEAQLALTSQSPQKLERLVGELDLPAERAFTVVADVTNESQVEDLGQVILSQFGHVDVLLNTVGGWSGGDRVEETSVGDWDHMLALNLRSAFLLSRMVIPYMRERGWGRIVHVGSKTGAEPRPKQVGYAVSKSGLITLTEVIAAELKGSGITANVVLPSIIDTLATRAAMPKANTDKWVPPEQIAATMRFLCSEAAGAINGAAIPIYGAV